MYKKCHVWSIAKNCFCIYTQMYSIIAHFYQFITFCLEVIHKTPGERIKISLSCNNDAILAPLIKDNVLKKVKALCNSSRYDLDGQDCISKEYSILVGLT